MSGLLQFGPLDAVFIILDEEVETTLVCQLACHPISLKPQTNPLTLLFKLVIGGSC